ncbi:NAD(P)/FAD-dependent oxidoreductase [Salinicola halophilus]|uniref:NAD(P)/FAD-dependent oxidoreductase n=1 Tax=Salinicola halophilus TaxID=184065 RepID=UPI0013A66307|nr:FAD-dependent oxidoreductase [Salinicola halophilus]
MSQDQDVSPTTTTPSPAATAHVVLVGSGDTHFYVAGQCARLRRAGFRVTLVTREAFAFPDWLGGMLGGEWQRDDLLIDPAHIARHGGAYRPVDAVRVDPANRRLTLDDGTTLDYDWLSLDCPPSADPDSVPGFYTARAIHDGRAESLWSLRQTLETSLADAESTLGNVAVLGGGPRGIEFAANLLALGERYGRRLPVSLIDSHRRALPGACRRANRWLARRLDRRGLQLELVATATRYEQGRLTLDDGSHVAADRLLIVDPRRQSPPGLAGLPTSPDRGPAEPDGLSPGVERILARDPEATLPARERAEALIRRLERAIAKGDPNPATPPSLTRWQALNLGDLRDIAWRGNLWCRGRWVRRLKHRRDRAEVARFCGED